MKASFDIEQIIASGIIGNELDYERAMIADRKLRLLTKENPALKKTRKKLRSIIQDYEQKVWNLDQTISKQQLKESEQAEKIAEAERAFVEKRKNIIRKKLKALDLTQENLAHILGHKSKTHMSELISGIKPFTLGDLVAINCLLDIKLNELVPVFLSFERVEKIKTAISELNNRKLINRLSAATCF